MGWGGESSRRLHRAAVVYIALGQAKISPKTVTQKLMINILEARCTVVHPMSALQHNFRDRATFPL